MLIRFILCKLGLNLFNLFNSSIRFQFCNSGLIIYVNGLTCYWSCSGLKVVGRVRVRVENFLNMSGSC